MNKVALALLRPPADAAALVVAAQGGDASAFRQLVERHHRRIYCFLLKHAISAAEAEELTQDVFLQAYLNLAKFRGESKCLSWLTGIALNLVRNYANRSPWRLIETDIDALPPDLELATPQTGAGSGNPEYIAAHAAAMAALAAGLGKLAPEARESLMLVAIEGMPYEEAAAVLGEPVGSVKSRVSRARRQLRELVAPGHFEVLAGRV
ncbi:MAG: sigma-70 family RNA polymerase sigma factor [Rhodocyclales bacterium]|nr:sigma-70 family RNA polymerase sigma factor [Rhodocyclales bacterium]